MPWRLAEALARSPVAHCLRGGTGPGVYAGGGRGLRVLPIDTLTAVAEQARLGTGMQRVVAVLDARMDEVYAAHLHWQHGQWRTESGPVLGAPEHVQARRWLDGGGNAQAAYPTRLAPRAEHVAALPTAAALLWLAPDPAGRWPGCGRQRRTPCTCATRRQTTAERPCMGTPA